MMERHSPQYNGQDITRNGNQNDTRTNNNRKASRKTSVIDQFDVSCKVGFFSLKCYNTRLC